MKRSRRSLVVALSLLCAVALQAEGTKETGTAPAPKLAYWGWLNAQSNEVLKVIDPAVAEFNTSNASRATLEYLPLGGQYITKLQTEFGTNTAADLVMVSDAGFLAPYVKAGKMAALDDLLGSDVMSRFSPALMQTVRFEGKTYAVPLARTSALVYYNTEIFGQNGLKPPRTMDELMGIIKILRSKGVTPFALCNKVPATWQGGLFMGMIGYRLGGKQLFYDLSSGTAKFSDATMVQAAQQFGDMVSAGAFPEDANNLTVDQARQTFMTGKAAMWFMLSSEISNLSVEVQKNGTANPVYGKVDFFNWPAIANGKTDEKAWILSPDYGIAISNGSPNKKAAADFIKLLLSEKYQGLFASISDSPSVNNVKFDTTKSNPLFLKLLDGLGKSTDSVTFPDRILGQQTLGGELNLATQPLVARENPRTVMQNLEDRAKALRAQ